MAFFFVRLLPLRPDFPTGMTPEEAATMKAHSGFLAEQLARGTLVVAGPVLAPSGAFGMGVFECASVEEARELLAHDPATGLGTYEIAPMAAATARPRSTRAR